MGAAAQIAAAYPKAGAPLAREIVKVAARVGAHPFDLANLINFETAGTFSPSVKNRISGATGLIQFMPKTARSLGTTTESLARMGQVEQMFWVEKYLKQFRKDKGTVQALFMSVFYPKAMSWPLDKEFPSIVQKSNPGINTVRDYVAVATRNAKLPSSGDVGAAPLKTLPFAIAQRASKVPIWVWVTTAMGIGTVIALLIRRPTQRRSSSR